MDFGALWQSLSSLWNQLTSPAAAGQTSIALGLFGLTLGLVGVGLTLGVFIWQRRIAREQEKIGRDLSERVFGSLPDFQFVEERVVELVEKANEDSNSKVAIMLYWLWFGLDLMLRENPQRDLGTLNAAESRFYKAILTRLLSGQETKLVLFSPRESEDELREFVASVMTWQLRRIGNLREIRPGSSEVGDLVFRYRETVVGLMEAIKQAGFSWEDKIIFTRSIPMLMFATREREGSRGIIYLGETPLLQEGAATGGFFTEDRFLVSVIHNQIKTHAEKASWRGSETQRGS